MGLEFRRSLSQGLLRTSPSQPLVYPFTIGMWIYPRASGTSANQYVWWAGQTGATNNFWAIGYSTLDQLIFRAQNTVARDATGVSMTANRWLFVVAQALNASARNINSFDPVTDTISTAISIQSSTPTVNAMSLGYGAASTPTGFFDGYIAEFWMLPICLSNATPSVLRYWDMRALAYGGPLALYGMCFTSGASGRAWSLYAGAEYRSFMHDEHDADDIYWGGPPAQGWSDTGGGPRFGAHPPLPPEYVRPQQNKRLLISS